MAACYGLEPTPSSFNFGVDVVDAIAAQAPDRAALLWSNAAGDERCLTFGEVAERSDRLAALLQRHGVVKGDHVIVLLPRIPEWQLSMVACHKIGAVPVPCTTMHTAEDVAYRSRHSAARAAITTTSCAGLLPDGLGLSVRICVGDTPPGWNSFTEADACSPSYDRPTIEPDDPGILFYTSGSTGMPKGVLHAARALHAWRWSARFWLHLEPGAVVWCTADTAWSKAGTSVLHGPWSQGATVVFHDGPFDPRRRVELLSRHRVQVFCAAATELRRLVQEDVRGLDLSAMRLTVSAGEAVNADLVSQWRERFGTPLLDGYGQTETLMTIVNQDPVRVQPGSMGSPLPGIQAAVLTAEDALSTTDTEGELLIRADTPQLFLGYLGEPERTAACFSERAGERWFHTGDLVRVDAGGAYSYLGRTDDLINSSGYRIGPQEVEHVLLQHPAVRECAVAGVPDQERGELVKAWVVLRDGVVGDDSLIAELQAHAKQTTAPYKYPRRIQFTDDLPKTPSGKVRRNVLRAHG